MTFYRLFSQTTGFFRAFIARLTGCPPSSRPILNLRSSCAPAGVYALSVPSASSLGWTIGSCMHCMHQKTDYACYAKTQLRKRLHTMHTETRIGVSVGLRARKCMQLGMHTKRIQSAYKHKKERKEGESFFYFFFILPVLLPSTARDFTGDHLLLFASSGIHGPHQSSLPVLLDHGRRHVRRSVIGGRSFERYIRIAHSHGKQNYHGRHHHRPPHSACGLRNRGGGLR